MHVHRFAVAKPRPWSSVAKTTNVLRIAVIPSTDHLRILLFLQRLRIGPPNGFSLDRHASFLSLRFTSYNSHRRSRPIPLSEIPGNLWTSGRNARSNIDAAIPANRARIMYSAHASRLVSVTSGRFVASRMRRVRPRRKEEERRDLRRSRRREPVFAGVDLAAESNK